MRSRGLHSLLLLCVLVALTVAHAHARPITTKSSASYSGNIELLEYDVLSQDLVFSFPYARFGGATQAELLFDLRHLVRPNASTCGTLAVLNSRNVELCASKHVVGGSEYYTSKLDIDTLVPDTTGRSHAVSLNVFSGGSSPGVALTGLDFTIRSVDGSDTLGQVRGFGLRWAPGFDAHLEEVVLLQPHEPSRINLAGIAEIMPSSRKPADEAEDMEDMYDIANDLETLRLLEADALALQSEIEARQKAVKDRIRKYSAKTPLKHLLEQCDGIMCAVKVVSERLCDKLEMSTKSFHDYVQFNSHSQKLASPPGNNSGKPPQTARNSTKSGPPSYGTLAPTSASEKSQPAILPIVLTHNSTSAASFEWRDQLKPKTQSTLVRCLELIAALVGLTTLCAYIRRKCMSMRRRVERAADREERRNARAYRRAARRAMVRKRWNFFLGTFSCFRAAPEPPRIEDYEEKRALILQDAFLEQSLEQAEKGEVMEAEIRELRHAHEIVANLIRVGENRFDLAPHLENPPRPIFVHPRSRASTNTLPSYNSESLPDYSSTPSEPSQENHSSTTDGFVRYTPTHTNEDGRFSSAPASSSSTGGSVATRYTPVSSVVAISPRCSAETLRTRQSGDSQD